MSGDHLNGLGLIWWLAGMSSAVAPADPFLHIVGCQPRCSFLPAAMPSSAGKRSEGAGDGAVSCGASQILKLVLRDTTSASAKRDSQGLERADSDCSFTQAGFVIWRAYHHLTISACS